jgi:hypothetical protein
VIYFSAENVNAADHLHIIEEPKYQDMLEFACDYHEVSIYYEYFSYLFTEGGYNPPSIWNDALTLYRELLEIAE